MQFCFQIGFEKPAPRFFTGFQAKQVLIGTFLWAIISPDANVKYATAIKTT
jgi:hypothetical protein